MLQHLRIRDLGVIEDAVIDLSPGLTVVTGETGAGKTMVVTALGLLLGARGDSGLVRHGAKQAVVEGFVALPPGHPALERVEEAGGDTEEGLVLIRSVSAEGRSRAHAGGRSAPVGLLADLAEHLVAVHGQADQWRLRQPDQHRELLDRFGGPDLSAARARYDEAYAAHATAADELSSLRAEESTRAQELDRLRTGLERIEALDPQPGEDEALRREDERLGHAEELRAGSGEAHLLLVGDDETSGASDGGVLGRVAQARQALAAVSSSDPALAALGERLTEIGYLVSELAADLSGYLADLEADPARLAWVQQRRADLAGLTRLYGESASEVLAWAAAAAQRHAALAGAEDRIEHLERSVADLARARERAADELTAARTRAGEALAEAITGELEHLSMGSARVAVAVTASGRLGPTGGDTVEVQLAANPGAPARSVTKAASGGELSRVMLAIEVATQGVESAVPTFVFDEVDAGVGGRAALDVGARLSRLAQHAQVIVVTHLAQVAAFADNHLVVTKADDGHVTRSGVRAVTDAERTSELARMMAGTDTAAARKHAEDVLARVAEVTGPR
jgi:DNA repair protein RecN (Recombination protein N)